MSRMILFAVLGAAAMMAGCKGTGDGADHAAAAVEQVRRADLALLQAETRRDLDGAMALIAPHAVLQPQGAAPIVGREAIRRFYDEQWFKLPFVEIAGEPDTIVVAASGDLAYFDGRSRMVLDLSGQRVEAAGKYLGVWRKLEGQWMLAAISWSANEPAR